MSFLVLTVILVDLSVMSLGSGRKRNCVPYRTESLKVLGEGAVAFLIELKWSLLSPNAKVSLTTTWCVNTGREVAHQVRSKHVSIGPILRYVSPHEQKRLGREDWWEVVGKRRWQWPKRVQLPLSSHYSITVEIWIVLERKKSLGVNLTKLQLLLWH